MAGEPARDLDVDATESRLDELLEHYRQALRAVELLPGCGYVPDDQHLHADWVRRSFAFRPLARIFLTSHIRAKLRTIAGHLEVEQFAGEHMDVHASKRLDDLVSRLRAYDERLAQRRGFWPRLPELVWVVVAPLLTTLLLGIPDITLTAGELLGDIIIYVFVVVLLLWPPLYFVGTVAGFHWKRLILMGQTAHIDVRIGTSMVLPWAPIPQGNTYESENRLFRTLGLPKPDEFPWDLVLAPMAIMLTAFAVVLFLLALALLRPATELGWPVLIAVVLLLASLLCIESVRRSILRDMRERKKRDAC